MPAFFVDELMPYANGIPASFWKYLMVLFRDVFSAGCETRGYRAAKTMTQFHMTKETAMQWTAALSVSGLFEVNYGFRYAANLPGVPTEFKYVASSTPQAWKCFVTALRDALLRAKTKNHKVQREGVDAFRIDLSFRVDNERQRNGLPRCWDAWHEKLVEAGKMEKTANGEFTWSVPKTHRQSLTRKEDLEHIETLERSLGLID
jgi:hypothetical protein